MWFVYFSCWAPEVAPPSPSLSPAEQNQEVELPAPQLMDVAPTEPVLLDSQNEGDERSMVTEAPPEPPTEDLIPEENEAQNIDADLPTAEKDTSSQDEESTEPLPPTEAEPDDITPEVRYPPYTTWTPLPEVTIHGPRGGVITTLENTGVRLEVLSVMGDWAQVICSGCPPPQQNQAGWISARYAVHPNDIEINSPVLNILKYRREWAKNRAIPEGVSATDLCMLVDVGYKINGNTAQWQYLNGQIKLNLSNLEEGPNITPPISHQELGWRCAVERGQLGDPI